MLLHYLVKCKNCTFYLYCITVVPDFKQLLTLFIQPHYLQLMLLYGCLNLAVLKLSCVPLWGYRKIGEFYTVAIKLFMQYAPVHHLLKDKIATDMLNSI